jgi:hypothetical protein
MSQGLWRINTLWPWNRDWPAGCPEPATCRSSAKVFTESHLILTTTHGAGALSYFSM